MLSGVLDTKYAPEQVALLCRNIKEYLSLDIIEEVNDFVILCLLVGHFQLADDILEKLATFETYSNLRAISKWGDALESEDRYHQAIIDHYWHQNPEKRPESWLEEELTPLDRLQKREVLLREEQTSQCLQYKPLADALNNNPSLSTAELGSVVPLESDAVSDIAARLQLFARIQSDRTLPSQKDTESAYNAAVRLQELDQASTDNSLEVPWSLLVDLYIRSRQYEQANRVIAEHVTTNNYKDLRHHMSYSSFLVRDRPQLRDEDLGFNITEAANDILEAIAVRSEHGRQEIQQELTISDILKQLKEVSWKYHAKEYRERGLSRSADLTFRPASMQTIGLFEVNKTRLPMDLKQFLSITNGFRGGEDWLVGGVGQIGKGSFQVGNDPEIMKTLRDACFLAQSRYLEPREGWEEEEGEEEEDEEDEDDEEEEEVEGEEDDEDGEYEDVESDEDSGEESEEDAHLMDFMTNAGELQYLEIGPFLAGSDTYEHRATYLITPAMISFWPGVTKADGKWRIATWHQNDEFPRVFGSFRHWICHEIRKLEENPPLSN